MVVLDRSRQVPRPPRVVARMDDVVPPGFRADPRLVEALASYVGRRRDLSSARRQELAGITASRLCASWGVSPPADADALICGLYERAIATSGDTL